MTAPLAVIRYLAELDAALAARNAPDRDQIVIQINEHIAQALGDVPDPSEADIAAVLTELGDPLRIADEAVGAGDGTGTGASASAGAGAAAEAANESDSAGRVHPVGMSDTRPPSFQIGAARQPPLLARSWVPVVAAALWLVGVAPLAVPFVLLPSGSMVAIPTGAAAIAMLLNLPLIGSIVIVICSPLFRAGERWAWGLVAPVSILVLLVMGLYNVYDETIWITTLLCMVIAVWTTVAITLRATRRSRSTALAPTAV